MSIKRKIVVIGLDGATFDIIRPLMRLGLLPNLKRLYDDGASGELESTIHPITPQAWTTFLTGKNAGKHGIFDFMTRKNGAYDIHFVNASMRASESILSILSRAKLRVGAVAIPFTFPPEPLNGFMLSGLDSPSEDHRAFSPPSLYKEISKQFGKYHIHLASPVGRKIDEKSFWRDIQLEDDNRCSISKYLLSEYPCDLFITVFNNTDRVQHQYLDTDFIQKIKHLDSDLSDNLIIRTYKNSDDKIGALLSDLDDDTTVIIMSDHGAGPINNTFYLNRWLHKSNLLEYKERQRKPLLGALESLRFNMKRFLPRWAKNIIKSRMGGVRDKVESLLFFSEIDWSKTKAFGFGLYGNIYINLKGREPSGIVKPGREYDDLRDLIISELSDLRDPRTGNTIIDKVYKREELYSGPYLESAPDLLIGWRDYSYYTSMMLCNENGDIFGPTTNIDCSEYKHVGTHRLNGVFIISGKHIRQGHKIQNAKIIDVAPTILYALGQAVPEEMEGRVLTEIFNDDLIRDNPPRYERSEDGDSLQPIQSYSDEESKGIEERLKGLGYLE